MYFDGYFIVVRFMVFIQFLLGNLWLFWRIESLCIVVCGGNLECVLVLIGVTY
jgi:hypothetical protein